MPCASSEESKRKSKKDGEILKGKKSRLGRLVFLSELLRKLNNHEF